MQNDYTEGHCCDDRFAYKLRSDICKSQTKSRFCMTSTTIKNSIIGRFTCPANKNFCPKDKNDIEVNLVKYN